ncbi:MULTISPECIES: acid stress response protein YqgB [Pseudescherichia]|nr:MULTISPECIES: acid stress response protein YqgB [Pseudescherichia]
MNQKPVARPTLQHNTLDNRAVYGLLSPFLIAIVVNCFTLTNTI